MTDPQAQYTKHTTQTDALDTLGSIIGPNEGRDAIHVAVFPVESAERLAPGDHVKIGETGRAFWVPKGQGIGIVDPFLVDFAYPGDWFWLLVYPRQITSLRHVWEHPSFPASQESYAGLFERHQPESFTTGQITEAQKAASEQWLRAWIESADCPDFDTTIHTMMAQRNGVSWGSEYVHFDGNDAHGEIPAEAWLHLGIFMDVDLSGDRPSYFSCSC